MNEENSVYVIENLSLHIGGINKRNAGLWLWPSELVLSHQVSHIQGSVLEIGCGIGLAGMLLLREGRKVTFIDENPEVITRLRENLERNNLVASFVCGDWLNIQGAWDWVIGSDILYAKKALPTVGRNYLIADPGRAEGPDGFSKKEIVDGEYKINFFSKMDHNVSSDRLVCEFLPKG